MTEEKYIKKEYSLKSGRVFKWIRTNGYTVADFADKLDISKYELFSRLKSKQHFTEEQIRRIVNLMKANKAIEAIWFPDIAEKFNVKRKVFPGRYFPDIPPDAA